jgi:4-methyl-5(b-hydroxyethyl)-thiazole monophosphate biosynthesis
MKRVLVPLAPGFEEIEAVTVIDILRRAGLTVTVAGTEDGPIIASRQTRHHPDCRLSDVRADDFDAIVLPGGQPGVDNLAADPHLRRLLDQFRQRGALIAAICAAPLLLSEAGLLQGRRATAHPSVRDRLRAGAIAEERVVVDGTLVTSQAAGTAMEFAFRLVEILCGPDKVREVNRSVCARLDR